MFVGGLEDCEKMAVFSLSLSLCFALLWGKRGRQSLPPAHWSSPIPSYGLGCKEKAGAPGSGKNMP